MEKLLIIGSNTVHLFNYIHLVKEAFKEIIFITDKPSDNYTYSDVKILYTTFSIKKPAAFIKSIFFIKHVIKTFDPCIIHSHQLTTNSLLVLLANRKLQKPCLFTAWGSDVLYNPSQGYFYKVLLKYILRHGRHFTSDSRHMADLMEKTVQKPLDILIANFGIDINDIKETEKQNIIYSNRQFKKLYRIDKILEAFSRFKAGGDGENWKLIVASDGEEKESLIKLAKDLGLTGEIEFTGWLTKEANLYNYSISKYYVSIPESDATSISLLEAMASGCIPILSDLPANREWVNDGVNGLIVKNIDCNFIKDALKIPFSQAQDINRKIIKDSGSKEANKEKFLAFYRHIIEEGL
ncbi:MAG: UDP-D-galactose:(glucosyl)lipopolysaccharide-1,6-D-galactosyltransferase [Bacteroidetes bacterium ADurb.Bin408]|nr:MAG: UDP-D-galactose:(glucosyl)lipopolysaccharide-1,6-D-galactosyltransferase [Bacteroidetes bacterium ADurb.Bin408]